jgi:nucleotide-binding universal stress UspA family protein
MDNDMTFRSILCAVDFSEQSRDALRWAGAFAAKFNARLTVVSVVDPLLAEAARIKLGRNLAATETEPALREFAAASWPGGAPTVQVSFETPVGEAAAAILKTATAEGVDLIAAGTQGLGGIRKWVLGSTTERLLRRTHIPILAVPPDGRGADRADAGRAIEVRRILAATDFSESSLSAAKYASQIARQFSAKLILAHVVEPLTVPMQWDSVLHDSAHTRADDARVRLQSSAEQLSLAQECEIVVSIGRAADTIGSLAEHHQTQLIVMGLTSARGAFAPRPGSIAYRVLSAGTVPVLVVPMPQAVDGERSTDSRIA